MKEFYDHTKQVLKFINKIILPTFWLFFFPTNCLLKVKLTLLRKENHVAFVTMVIYCYGIDLQVYECEKLMTNVSHK